jgi:hypothetical protein
LKKISAIGGLNVGTSLDPDNNFGFRRLVSVGNTDNYSEVTFKNKFAVTRMRMWTLLRMKRRTGGWWRTTRKARKKL